MKKLHNARILPHLSQSRIGALLRDAQADWVLTDHVSARPVGPVVMAWQCLDIKKQVCKPLMHFRGTTLVPSLSEVIRASGLRETLRDISRNNRLPDNAVYLLLFKSTEPPSPSFLRTPEVFKGRQPFSGSYRLVALSADACRSPAGPRSLYFSSLDLPRPFAGFKSCAPAPFFQLNEDSTALSSLWMLGSYGKPPLPDAPWAQGLLTPYLATHKAIYVECSPSVRFCEPILALYCRETPNHVDRPLKLLEAEGPFDISNWWPAHISNPTTDSHLWELIAAWLQDSALVTLRWPLPLSPLVQALSAGLDTDTPDNLCLKQALGLPHSLTSIHVSTTPDDFGVTLHPGATAEGAPYHLQNYLIPTLVKPGSTEPITFSIPWTFNGLDPSGLMHHLRQEILPFAIKTAFIHSLAAIPETWVPDLDIRDRFNCAAHASTHVDVASTIQLTRHNTSRVFPLSLAGVNAFWAETAQWDLC